MAKKRKRRDPVKERFCRHHRQRFAARTRFRTEVKLAEDHRLPRRTFRRVVRRMDTVGVGEHKQAVAMGDLVKAVERKG